MKKVVKKTGDFGLGQMVHVIHMTDDVDRLREWWEDVFGGFTYMGQDGASYWHVEDRNAALLMVSDLCIEVMAPAFNDAGEVNSPHLPVGKFYSKFGEHLHSVGYVVDDMEGQGDFLIEKGVFIGKPGGGKIEKMDPDVIYFYPSPKDTGGLMVELTRHEMVDDPRNEETWSSLLKVWKAHPLTIERFSYVTLGVRDLDEAVRIYRDVMQAVPVAEGVDEDLGSKYVTLQLGDCLLQLAQPLEPTSDLGQHVEKYGNFIYSMRFKITDADSAQEWLTKKGVKTTRPRPGLLVLDTADTFGAPIFLSSEEIEGDPFAS